MTNTPPNTKGIAQARSWYWQRISAMALAIFVVIHLVIMMIAVQGGLTAAEILSRTQGSIAFGVFYALFVVACAVHVPLGVAKIAQEWTPLSAAGAALVGRLFAVVILVMGFAAVWGVL